MKYIESYNLFESRFLEFREVISTIKDICLEFDDNNCSYHIEPSNDIRFQDINMPFYIDVDIDRRIIKQDDKRSGFGTFPEWFIETCKLVEDYMLSEGFKTLLSVRYPTDWINLDMDELEEQSGLIQKVKLEFLPI